MRPTIILCLLGMLCTHLTAQITKEKSYSENIYLVRLSESEYRYMGFLNGGSSFNIYDLSHSLEKTITIPTKSGYKMNSIGYLSKNLFDNDNGYEYIAYYYNSTTYTYYAAIIDDDGSEMAGVNGAISVSVFNVNGVGAKAIFLGTGQSAVYSLPGIMYGMNKKGEGSTGESTAYPNPTSLSYITIEHEFAPGTHQAAAYIYNANGQLMDKLNVMPGCKTIEVSIQNYPGGNYLYTLEANNLPDGSGTFVISR